MRNFQYARLTNGDRVIITIGKFKGVIGEVTYQYSSDITITPISAIPKNCPETISIKYSNVEVLDEYGNIVDAPVLDMTGREITEGTWITYSVGGGKKPHALEIGKVVKISPIGCLSVLRAFRNGSKVVPYSWQKETRSINDADRTIVLPCEITTMTEWVLKDFENLKEQS